jgi:hypothetical protein
MKITTLDPSKYKRFFAFGCSNTNYMWPTWADIIGQDIEFYENWGEPGGSNHFIFNSVIEADAKYKFDKNDLVIVHWTTKEREGRYSNNKWIHATPGSVEKVYDKNWIEKFYFDDRSQLIRDLAYIQAIQLLLENKECDWANLFYVDIFNFTNKFKKMWEDATDKTSLIAMWTSLRNTVYDRDSTIPDSTLKDQDVIELYKDIFTKIDGVFYHSFEFFHTKERIAPNNDMHATPIEALQFLDWIWPKNTISSNARLYCKDWNEKIFQADYSQNAYPFPMPMNQIKRL